MSTECGIRIVAKNTAVGYAESYNGTTFVRKDSEAGITVSADGWDSEMVCYPKVFALNSKTYMIYSGNSFGANRIRTCIVS